MIIDAQQAFTLPWAAGEARALAFVRDPARALARVRFLRDLRAEPSGVSGELLVPLPGLGEVDLPFRSDLQLTAGGAALTPRDLTGERAWVEVSGQAHTEDGALHFAFQFRAHLAVPGPQGWGGAAFEKMIRAAAGRTLERVARELPAGIAQAAQEEAGPAESQPDPTDPR